MALYYMISILFTMGLISITLGYEGRDTEVLTTLLSGHFSNEKTLAELRKGGVLTAQNVIDIYSFPINYPALKGEIVIFFNMLSDGNVTRQQYMALKQLGPVIDIDHFNVVPSKIFNSHATIDISKLESSSRDDLETAPICQSYVTRIGETLFTGEYPNCNVDGFNYETYKTTHTCDSLTFYVDSTKFPEAKSKLPYSLNKEESYPVPSTIFQGYDKYKAMCNY